VGAITTLLVILRWPQGPGPWDLAYPIFEVFGVSALLSAQFVGLSAATPNHMSATAITTYHFSQQLGIMFGVTFTNLIGQRVFKAHLLEALGTNPRTLEVSIFNISLLVLC
jgi:hypothetical protein